MRSYSHRAVALLVLGSVLTVLACSNDGAAGGESATGFRTSFLSGELDWSAVVGRAGSEGEVEFYHWGGSEALNSWIEFSARPAIEQYGIRANFRRGDTRDVVDLILAELASGRGTGEGSVDVVWINGENFRTLREADALFGAFADRLEASRSFSFDPSDPASSVNLHDFGTPTDLMEMPWAAFQFTIRVDAARVDPETVPRTFKQLESWITTHPGRFTYVAPPHYIGSTFLHSVLYGTNPDGTGYEPFLRDRSQIGLEELTSLVRPGFDYLRRIEPFLLGGSGVAGEPGSPIYPSTATALQARFVGGEVDFDMEFGVYDVDRDIRSGAYPQSVRNIVFPEFGMIKDMSFLAIPANAPNPAAALVAINALSTPESHLSKLVEIGFAPAIDLRTLSRQQRDAFDEAAPDLRGVTADELAEHEAPGLNADLVDLLDAVWTEYIAERSARPFEQIVADAWQATAR